MICQSILTGLLRAIRSAASFYWPHGLALATSMRRTMLSQELQQARSHFVADVGGLAPARRRRLASRAGAFRANPSLPCATRMENLRARGPHTSTPSTKSTTIFTLSVYRGFRSSLGTRVGHFRQSNWYTCKI